MASCDTISLIDSSTNAVTATLPARGNPEDVTVSMTARPTILGYNFQTIAPTDCPYSLVRCRGRLRGLRVAWIPSHAEWRVPVDRSTRRGCNQRICHQRPRHDRGRVHRLKRRPSRFPVASLLRACEPSTVVEKLAASRLRRPAVPRRLISQRRLRLHRQTNSSEQNVSQVTGT
jgi:YVTN family beta-propeller protein